MQYNSLQCQVNIYTTELLKELTLVVDNVLIDSIKKRSDWFLHQTETETKALGTGHLFEKVFPESRNSGQGE